MTRDSTPPSTVTPEARRAIAKWILQAALGLVAYGLILFISAGRLDWAWGWVLLAVVAAVLAAHPLILIPIHPDLLAEREKGLRDPRVQDWDRWVAGFAAGVLPIVSWIVAGLDNRLGWSGPLSPLVHLAGLALCVLGYALFLWAMASNAFFAEGVRIQKDRGHTVATGGPYRLVRHPGYSGAIVSILAAPILLGSWWALIPAGASAAMYVVRTYLEDRTLQADLPGYREYTQRVRCRLLPGVW